jgi:hypothetical protein
MIIGLGTPFFVNSIMISFENLIIIDSEFISSLLKNIPFIFTILGFVISFFLINCFITSKETIFTYKMTSYYRQFYTFLTQK